MHFLYKVDISQRKMTSFFSCLYEMLKFVIMWRLHILVEVETVFHFIKKSEMQKEATVHCTQVHISEKRERESNKHSFSRNLCVNMQPFLFELRTSPFRDSRSIVSIGESADRGQLQYPAAAQ
jgi:hypothetical protein